jgi:hypothetical protein
MNRQIVVFDTTNGDIVRIFNVPPVWTTTCSGSGTVDGQILVGSGFSAINPDDINTVVVVMDGRTMRCGFKEVLSDTELVFMRTPIHGSVTYEVLKRNDPGPQPITIVNREINKAKQRTGRTNLDALKISLEQWVDAGNYFVDIGDGNKIKNKDQRITYD